MRISLKNFVRYELGVNPPADRDCGCGEENEEHGISRAVFAFVAYFVTRHLGIESTFPAALGEIVRRGHGGTFLFHLFSNSLGSFLNKILILGDLRIEGLLLAGHWVAAFLFKEHGAGALFEEVNDEGECA